MYGFLDHLLSFVASTCFAIARRRRGVVAVKVQGRVLWYVGKLDLLHNPDTDVWFNGNGVFSGSVVDLVEGR